MKSKSFFNIVTLVVVIINITSIVFLDFFYSQIIRLISSFLYLLFFLFLGVKDRLLLPFVTLLVIADGFDLYYLQPYVIEIYSVIKMVAFLILCVMLSAKLRFQKLGNAITLLFVVVIAINILIGYKAITETTNVLDYTQILSIQAYWVICILSCALAAKYYFLNESKKAVYFTGFTFLFVFTDLNGFIANFFDADLFFFTERILYFSGFMCLGYYVFFNKQEQIKS